MHVPTLILRDFEFLGNVWRLSNPGKDVKFCVMSAGKSVDKLREIIPSSTA